MTILSRALSPLAIFAALPVLLAAAPAVAATAPKAQKPAAVKATTDIIPLPLNPVLPAGQRICADKTASGLGYTMLRPATGDKPAAEDFVLVNYIGYLAEDGTVFDQGTQAAFPVNGIIPGFSEGVQLLSKTGIVRVCVPSALGYGEMGTGPIPANADLVFQVELIDYKTAAEIDAMRQSAAQPAAPAAPTSGEPE